MARAGLNPERDKVVVETLYRERDLVKQVPGATWNHKQSVWQAPLSWGTCAILRGVFGAHLEVGPDLAEWATDELATRVTPAVALREAIDALGSPKLFGYQRAGVQFLKTAKRALLCDGLGAGKAQPLSEPVLTPSGFVPMGKIQSGDFVIGSDGKPTMVYGVYRQGIRPVYKVSFSDGTYAYADQDHLWRVQSLKNFAESHWQVLSTAELLKRGVDQVVQTRGSRHHKWRIPFVAPVEFTPQSEPLPIDPYVLGVLLGDGSLSRPSRVGFCSVDQEIVDRVSARLPQGLVASASKTDVRSPDLIGVRITNGAGSNVNQLLDALRELGLYGHRAETKFVPERYLHASVEERLDLLRGIMDTDGSAGKNNGAGFSSASEQLRDDVAFIVRSLGGLARCNVKEKTGGNFPAYGVYIRMPDGLVPFHLTRKAALIHTPIKYTRAKFISAIEYSHEEETQCIAVTAGDHCYVTRDFVVTHNTRQALMTAMAHYESHLNDSEYPSPFPILAVVPNSTKTGWQREANLVWPGLVVQVIKGSATLRRQQFETPAHMYVINWEGVRGHSRLAPYGSIALKRCKECGGEDERISHKTCEVHLRELNHIDFGMVIADEAHRMKDPSAKQTRALWAATGAAPYRYGLTGTPIADAPDDLWSILHWLDPQEWPSRVKYIDLFAQLQYNAFGAPIVTGLKPETKELFFTIVNPRMRRMPKELVLSHLPPVMRERRDVEMTPKQKKAYEDMRDRMVAELGDGGILTAPSPLTKMTRLIQFSSAYAELEEFTDPKTNKLDTRVRLIEPSCKVDAFMADLPDFGDDSVVVFAQSRQLIYILHDRLEKAKIPHGLITGKQNEDERQKAIDDFQSGRTQFVLATLGAGGTGLNLYKGRIAVYLQRSWSLIENEQSEGRVHRIGSEMHDSVLYIDYVTTDSVEELQHAAVASKFERLEEILRDKDLMKRALENDAFTEYLGRDVHDAEHDDHGTEGVA